MAKVRVGDGDAEGDPRGADRGGGQDGEWILVGRPLVAYPHLVEAKRLGRHERVDQLGRRRLGKEPHASRAGAKSRSRRERGQRLFGQRLDGSQRGLGVLAGHDREVGDAQLAEGVDLLGEEGGRPDQGPGAGGPRRR